MSTAMMADTKNDEQIEAEQAILRRHLRRRVNISWRSDDETKGEFTLGQRVWSVELSFSKKHQKHRVRFTLVVPELGIDRCFDTLSGNVYTVAKEAIVIHSSLRLAQSLDLMDDDF
jgi:hypothetical protein